MIKSKDLPDNWDFIQIKDSCKLVMGQSPPGSSYNTHGDGMPFLQGKTEFNNTYPVHIKYTNKPLRYAKKGSILMSVRAPVGDVNIANIDYCIGRGLSSINLVNGNNKFLFYLLIHLKPKIEVLGTGSTFKAVTKSGIEKFKIPIPPIESQNKIVEILEKAEKLKQYRKEADRLSNEYLRSLFVEMFGDPIKNTKQFPLKFLEDCCNKITDGEHQNPKLTDHGCLLIMAKDVREDLVDFSQKNFVSHNDYKKFIKKCNPENGDILLVSRGATIGRCTSVNVDLPFCLMGSVILIKPKILLTEYLEYLFKNENFIKNIIKLSSSSAQQAIYLKHIKKLKIPIPPKEIQENFSKQVLAFSNIKNHQKQSKQEIDNIFSTIMQKAFKGELVC